MPKVRKSCTTVTYKRSKSGKTLPASQWRTVQRCAGRKLKTSAKARWRKRQTSTSTKACRRGGTGPLAHLFIKCPVVRRASK